MYNSNLIMDEIGMNLIIPPDCINTEAIYNELQTEGSTLPVHSQHFLDNLDIEEAVSQRLDGYFEDIEKEREGGGIPSYMSWI
jgi:hypothetical protein